jgi:NADPH-dependent glutamate synthase beta subunit-like oxidoreductase
MHGNNLKVKAVINNEVADTNAPLDDCVEVLVIGADPDGSMLANILGQYGRKATVLEARDKLIDLASFDYTQI